MRSTFYILLFFVVGCSTMDDVESMRSTTERLNQKTNEVHDQLKQTSTTTENLKEKIAQLFDSTLNLQMDERQGNSWDIRDKAWTRMNSARKMSMKLAAANAYFSAMEDQLWKDAFFDDQENLERLDKQAVDQFFEYANESIQIENTQPFHIPFNTNPFLHDNQMNNLYALAALMHLSNPNAEALYARHRLPKKSILGMIKDALREEAAFNQKGAEAFPATTAEILGFKTEAVYLIRLRANFLGAMALGMISGLQYKSEAEQDWAGFWNGLLFGWTADLSFQNLAQLETERKWLHESNRTCQWLIDYENTCHLENALKVLFQKLHIRFAPRTNTPLMKKTVEQIEYEMRALVRQK